jgi:hypothetical protein
MVTGLFWPGSTREDLPPARSISGPLAEPNEPDRSLIRNETA